MKHKVWKLEASYGEGRSIIFPHFNDVMAFLEHDSDTFEVGDFYTLTFTEISEEDFDRIFKDDSEDWDGW